MGAFQDPDLLSFIALDIVGVEFSSVCNLQCVYCDVSAPGYHGRHTSSEVLEAAYKVVSEGRPAFMNFTGIGELTTMPNWVEAASPFMAVPGMIKSLTTNLQKQMDEAEVETLARFDAIHISIDTADARLLREIRRKSELRNITTNIARIRAQAIKINARPPNLRFNVVITDRSALTLLDLSAFAIACGIDDVLLIDLNDTAFFIDKAIVRHVRHLPDKEFSEFVRQLEESSKLLSAHGKHIYLTGDLEDYINRRVHDKQSGLVLQPGQTRLCPQLWNYAVVKENGRISHCCANMMSTKSLRDHTFTEIMEDEEVRSWRKSLLSGQNLPRECIKCHWASSASPQQLLELVERLHQEDLSGLQRLEITQSVAQELAERRARDRALVLNVTNT